MKWLAALLALVVLVGGIVYLGRGGGNEWIPTQLSLSGIEAPADTAEYRDDIFKFSVQYPKDLEVQIYDEDDGSRTVVFESATPGVGFQVFVAPYTEDHITQERFEIDMPSGVMVDPQDVLIDGTAAKIFFGEHEGLGQTREVWFIKNGYLYEVTAYKVLDEWLVEIMETWRFL